ncbi:DUF3016 family protein [Pseudorhodoplanes sinuspersici]|nr:DUF3016 family protein [Pseudorhodoplanes sinuspersici]
MIMLCRTFAAAIVIAAACAIAAPSPAMAAPAAVKVTFVHPERFNDDDFRYRFTPRERAAAVSELTGYIVRAAQSLLKPGASLRIEILDFQRAGIYNPLLGNAANVRILKDITPPRITLRYQLTGGGKPQSGRETLTDMNYLMNPSARFSGDPFVYEKALLADWLRKIAAR